ncbi:MAG: ASPIC/UnbV domain-containing protein, partial [Candidatus Latescibacterota bacterium]|nr:ASPIC/UnbV domain-containing protein [Candidatus Latescibacterota bacterium]
DGDIDFVALGKDGVVSVFENDGGNANAWLRLSLVGLQTRGTKNNLHGYGSRIEVKAGHHYQVKYATGPITHFGLGEREKADLVRVTWSNGVPQNVFTPTVNQTLREKQVLKGSCPYLYVWDGEKYQFVTDLLGAAPLGLQLADGVIAPDNPREIVKVDSKWMVEKNGEYVFQFTEELWETIYLDRVALWAVDHSSEIEAFTDERFLPPPYPDLKVVTTRGRVYPILVENTEGEDVTDRMSAYDYRFPNILKPTRYQGIVEPHVVTMSFGDVSYLDHPTLVMRGWIFWSDTSINVAMSQGGAVQPAFPLVDVWRDGEWVTLDRPFGLPKGKDKWMVLDLRGKVDMEDTRVRIRTNYQIYYDLAFLSEVVADPGTRVTRLQATSADLHYSGFTEMVRPTPDAPHLYDYQKKVTLPVWKDMTGFATRYGDVVDLLSKTDDLMVVFTAGDEVTCKFDAGSLPELAAGMTRSFFFLSDGWDKDADRNTVTGNTVLPLPFHRMSAYPYPADESFPDTEAHRRLITESLTRKVGPKAYRDYVRSKRFSERPEGLPWENTKGVQEAGK